MAPPLPLFVLHEKKEEDSTKKYVTDVLKNKAPPLSLETVHLLNKQLKTQTLETEGVCLELYSVELSVVAGDPVK